MIRRIKINPKDKKLKGFHLIAERGLENEEKYEPTSTCYCIADCQCREARIFRFECEEVTFAVLPKDPVLNV